MEAGNFGDHKQLAGYHGLYECRLDFGPGFRLYFCIEKQRVVVLLVGGDKTTQNKDIAIAWALRQVHEEANEKGK